MGEVLLSIELEDADEARRRAFDDALAERRWRATDSIPSTFTCYFENGFMDQVRRIVAADVLESARRADIGRWHAAHVWSATEHTVLRSSDPTSPSGGAARGRGTIWTDGGDPVGPVADVMISVALPEADDAKSRAFEEALTALHWRPLPPLRLAFVHQLDLGMFEPIGARVVEDLRAAAQLAGLDEWQAVWSASTWEHTRLEGPPPPRKMRALPWDENH